MVVIWFLLQFVVGLIFWLDYFGTMTGMIPKNTSDEVLKDYIQASNSENSILKRKVDILGNNDCVEHNTTQCCNQPPADTIVHDRRGIGDVLSGTLNGWVRMMDDIVLRLRYEKYRVHPNFWASPRQIFKMSPIYIEKPYIWRKFEGMRLSPFLRLGQECMVCSVCCVMFFCCIFVLNNWPV